jgi:hypothetical protein
MKNKIRTLVLDVSSDLVFPADHVGVLGMELAAKGVGEWAALVLLHIPGLYTQGLHQVLPARCHTVTRSSRTWVYILENTPPSLRVGEYQPI